jgi:hypothetical protein
MVGWHCTSHADVTEVRNSTKQNRSVTGHQDHRARTSARQRFRSSESLIEEQWLAFFVTIARQ